MFDELFERKGLSLEALRKFCEVADAGSHAKAADQNPRRDTSTYSRTITGLEDFFEFKLFTREGRKSLGKLTPQGESLRLLVTEYFNAMIALGDDGAPPEFLTIAAGETLLQWVICTNIDPLRESLSPSRIELISQNSDQIVHGISEGSLDFGIIENSSELPKHFGAVELGQLEYALFLSDSLAAKHRRASEKQLLAKLPLAGLEYLGLFTTQLDRAARSEGYQLNFAVMLTSFPQLAQALRAGTLAGFLPTLASNELTQHGLKMVRLPFLNPLAIKISLIWNTRLAPFRPYMARASSLLQTILKFESSLHRVPRRQEPNANLAG
jgi:DNA-binding transcriptional LysR family regulator